MADLQVMVELQHGEFQIWSAGFDPPTPSTGYLTLADLLESARGSAVHFNMQPASQPTGFNDVTINEANSCNPSPVATSDFTTAFPHEPSTTTSATQQLQQEEL